MLGRRALIAACALLLAPAAQARPHSARAPHAAARHSVAPCPDISGDVTDTDVNCALQRWYDTFNARNANAVTTLYATERERVLLLSTLDPAPLTTSAGIHGYFTELFKKPNVMVAPTPTLPKKVDLFRTGGVASGFYRFSWTGSPGTPARYSFVFVLNGRQLTIATHHSSQVPAPKPTRRK